MDLHSLAAEVLVALADSPGGQQSVEQLADRIMAPRTELVAACTLLSAWGIAERSDLEQLTLAASRVRVGGPLVVVIENTPAVAHVLDALLDSEGYRILHASQFADGLALLRVVLPALVIADSFSPSAAEVLERLRPLRERAAPAPVMLFTAYRDLDETSVLAAGFAGMLAKPFDVDVLLEQVRRVTGGPHPD